MIENKNIRIVKEDMVLGNGCNKSEKVFGVGYDNFQYPLTVSFCSEGKYEVVIQGKNAAASKVSFDSIPQTYKEEFLNYIIDFSVNTEWDNLKRREQLRALFTSWCFIFGINVDINKCYEILDAISYKAGFDIVEEFKNYMVELIV